MRINGIVKHDLENRAKNLRGEGRTLEEISNILSAESNVIISLSSVYRYFESNEKAAVQAIEKSDKLKAKVAEAEISTIEDRQTVIKALLLMGADESLNPSIRIKAYSAANEALDSLDKRLGKLSSSSGVTFNNINSMKLSELPTDVLLSFINEAREQADISRYL